MRDCTIFCLVFRAVARFAGDVTHFYHVQDIHQAV